MTARIDDTELLAALADYLDANGGAKFLDALKALAVPSVSHRRLYVKWAAEGRALKAEAKCRRLEAEGHEVDVAAADRAYRRGYADGKTMAEALQKGREDAVAKLAVAPPPARSFWGRMMRRAA